MLFSSIRVCSDFGRNPNRPLLQNAGPVSYTHLDVYKRQYQEFLRSKDKASFRAAHCGEIANYEKAARFLKEKFAGAAFPSMKALKAQKAALTRQRSQQKELLRQSGAERRQMEIVRPNVGEILGRKKSYIDRNAWLL